MGKVNTEHLFVYGTLGPGRPNAHILEAIGGTWSHATVRGHLKQQGWGANQGYPGLLLDENSEKIQGFVFSSENLKCNWSMLDDFEGEEYKRVLTKVSLADDNKIDAYIYQLTNIQQLD